MSTTTTRRIHSSFVVGAATTTTPAEEVEEEDYEEISLIEKYKQVTPNVENEITNNIDDVDGKWTKASLWSTSRYFRISSLLLSVYSCRCCGNDYSTLSSYRSNHSCLKVSLVFFLITSGMLTWCKLSWHWLDINWLNPVVRIQFTSIPSISTKQESLVDGKFCHYNQLYHRWHCQECYWGKCHTLRKRNHVCPPFRRQEWDEPYPRFKSHYYDDVDAMDTSSMKSSSTNRSSGDNDLLQIPFRILTRFGISKAWRVEYEQPICSVTSCFDLNKCSSRAGEHVLTIYTKSPIPESLQKLVDKSNNSITSSRHYHYEIVKDPNKACLIVVFPHQYETRQDLVSSSHWNDGRNHLIWNAACQFFSDPSKEQQRYDRFCDFPFSNLHYGLAAMAHTQLSSAHVRYGYDVPLPLPRFWKRPMPIGQVPLASQRPVLLSFRGNVQDTLQPSYQHRWLATEYWNVMGEDERKQHPEVVVNAQCVHRRRLVWREQSKNQILRTYDNDNPESSFEYLLLNSTFVFTPGGSGVNTYRFGEALSAGAIPVVTPDFVPPFAPDLDWSSCLVVVSESRIVDLPRILRQDYCHNCHGRHDAAHNEQHNLQQLHINQRQQACLRLLRASMGDKFHEDTTKRNNNAKATVAVAAAGGWLHDEQVVFERAMAIMRLRIRHAVDYQDQVATALFSHHE